MENSALCKLPRYCAFTLAWDQRRCTKPLYTGCFWGPGGLCFGGAGSSRSGSGACPKHRTPRAELPSSAGLCQGWFCSVYFANEPLGGCADGAGPCCSLCPPSCCCCRDPEPVPAAPWSLLSRDKGCPGSREPSVPRELPGRCGAPSRGAKPQGAGTPTQMCPLGSFPALKTPTELLPRGRAAPLRQQCGNIDLTWVRSSRAAAAAGGEGERSSFYAPR